MSRPFMDILRDLRNGKTHDDLTEALATLTQAVQDTGKKGSLVFTITIEPASKGDGSTVLVTDDVKVKAPAESRKASIFYTDIEGDLVRQDPKQQALDLKILPATQPLPIKEIA